MYKGVILLHSFVDLYQDMDINLGNFIFQCFAWVLLSIVILGAWSYYRMTLTKTAKMLNQFPQSTKYPLIGSLYHFFCKPEDVILRISSLTKTYGRTVAFWFSYKPYLMVMNAEIVEKVFSSNRHLRKGEDYATFKWLFGNGLLTSEVEIWKNDRKLLNPAFKYTMLLRFQFLFNKHSNTLIQMLEQTFKNSNKSTNLHPLFGRFTIDTITESALGTFFDAQNDPECKLLEMREPALEVFHIRLFKPLMALPIIREFFGVASKQRRVIGILEPLFTRVIKERKQLQNFKTDANDDNAVPFIDLLLNSKSDEDIISHVNSIFGAGFETTASSINYTLFLLALHPQVQKKLSQEIQSIFGDDVTRDVTASDISVMNYMEMCIKESMRLYPPSGAIIRRPEEDIPIGNGKTIPKGCNIYISLTELHRDPNAFPEPSKFDPERFSVENCKKMNPYAYIPFAMGARNCIGQKYAMQEIKTALTHILRRFEVFTDSKQSDIKLIISMVLQEAEPILLSLRRRQS